LAIVSVMGMHRSGTSCLAGALQEAGLHCGETSKGDPYNARGNRENLAIRYLHNDVLEASGGDWSHPPDRLVYTTEHEERRDQLIAGFAAGARHWTFKDPRTLLALPFWRATGQELVLVGIFRHPLRVARSLASRDAMSLTMEHGISLWVAHNRILLELHRADPFPLLCFDDPPDDFRERLRATVAWLNRRLAFDTALSPEAAAGFYDRTLVHQAPGESRHGPLTSDPPESRAELGPEAQSLYAELVARAR
jgi:hypothetical protein